MGAHASDTLARKLIKNDELKLNFPDDHTEVYAEKKEIDIGVIFYPKKNKWKVQRWSKNEKKNVCNGSYDNKETAIHESDTLARILMKNGEHGHRLNYPGNETKVYIEKKTFPPNSSE